MEQLAPEAVGVAAGFGAAGEVALRGHGLVVEAATAGQVLIAVSEVEDLESRIGKRLTAGAPGPGNKGAIGKLLAHPGPARNPQTWSICDYRSTAPADRAKKIVYWRRFHAVSRLRRATPWARFLVSI
jgi:hypothetical protein